MPEQLPISDDHKPNARILCNYFAGCAQEQIVVFYGHKSPHNPNQRCRPVDSQLAAKLPSDCFKI